MIKNKLNHKRVSIPSRISTAENTTERMIDAIDAYLSRIRALARENKWGDTQNLLLLLSRNFNQKNTLKTKYERELIEIAFQTWDQHHPEIMSQMFTQDLFVEGRPIHLISGRTLFNSELSLPISLFDAFLIGESIVSSCSQKHLDSEDFLNVVQLLKRDYLRETNLPRLKEDFPLELEEKTLFFPGNSSLLYLLYQLRCFNYSPDDMEAIINIFSEADSQYPLFNSQEIPFYEHEKMPPSYRMLSTLETLFYFCNDQKSIKQQISQSLTRRNSKSKKSQRKKVTLNAKSIEHTLTNIHLFIVNCKDKILTSKRHFMSLPLSLQQHIINNLKRFTITTGKTEKNLFTKTEIEMLSAWQKESAASVLQSHYRGFASRKKQPLSVKKAEHEFKKPDNLKKLIQIQQNTRRFLARKKHQQQVKAATTIQKYTRGFLARKKHQQQVKAATTIQQYTRRFLARKKHQQQVKAATTIQQCMRGFLARKKCMGVKRAIIRNHVFLPITEPRPDSGVGLRESPKMEQQTIRQFLEEGDTSYLDVFNFLSNHLGKSICTIQGTAALAIYKGGDHPKKLNDIDAYFSCCEKLINLEDFNREFHENGITITHKAIKGFTQYSITIPGKPPLDITLYPEAPTIGYFSNMDSLEITVDYDLHKPAEEVTISLKAKEAQEATVEFDEFLKEVDALNYIPNLANKDAFLYYIKLKMRYKESLSIEADLLQSMIESLIPLTNRETANIFFYAKKHFPGTALTFLQTLLDNIPDEFKVNFEAIQKYLTRFSPAPAAAPAVAPTQVALS